MKHKFIKMIFFASFVWIAGVILTPDALGADTLVYAIIGGTQTLGTVDLNTGVFTQISTVAVSDYELGVYGGALYGAGAQCGCLIQLNTSTGVPTFAPTYFQQNASGFGVLNGFGSTTDGLFAMAAAVPGGVNYLWSVNPATGVPTLIGSTGVVAGGGTGFLSASNDSSKLYWEIQNGYTDTLYSINTSTGAATLIGAWTFNGYSNTGNPFSMVFVGGTLWANFYSAGFGTINTSSGAQTLVSTAPTGSSNAFFGLAPYPLASSTPTFIGSLPHLAAEGGWTTTFTYVNKGTTSASAQTSLFAPNGTPLILPINLPQTSGSTTASSVTQTIAPNASFIMQATGPANVTYQEGSAQLAATGNVDGFEIFHFDPTQQEAVVPLETRNAPSYLLAFDNTNTVVTGVAVGNVSGTSATVPVGDPRRHGRASSNHLDLLKRRRPHFFRAIHAASLDGEYARHHRVRYTLRRANQHHGDSFHPTRNHDHDSGHRERRHDRRLHDPHRLGRRMADDLCAGQHRYEHGASDAELFRR